MEATIEFRQMTADEYLEHWGARQVWTHNTAPHHRRRFQFVASHLQGERFLDCGCAFGHSTAMLAEMRPGHWEGADFSEKGVEQARANFPGIPFHFVRDAADLSRLGCFDCVVLSEVLEHVPEDRALVVAAMGIADRALLITTPLRKVNDPGHVRIYDRPALGTLFDGYRRKIIEEDPFYYVVVRHAKA